MIRPYILAENNWKSLKSERFEVAVLPWGATEAHNFHLPYGTDIIEAEELAAAAAAYAWQRGGKVVVLPAIPFGVNTGQSDIYLDINMNPTTQLAILDDITATLLRQGMRKLVLFNSHGGNNFEALIRELGLRYPEMFICLTNWFKALDRNTLGIAPGDHADEVETSLLLHLRPQLVLPKSEWGSGKAKKFKIKAFSESWAWAERRWSQVTEDTGVGDPSAATAEKGAKLMEILGASLGEFFLDLCESDPNDMYTSAD
jgi:creatinine amidohydrolase